MKMVRLYAYLYHNIGDDLMVEVLLSRYKHILFYCDSNAPIRNKRLTSYSNFIDKEKLYEKYGRLNHLLNLITLGINENFFFNWLFRQYEKRCKCSIYIGGSLFIPRNGESIEERIAREQKKMQQPPLYIIGANFGDEEKKFTEAFESFFAECGGISFRDKISYDRFPNLVNTQYAPDIVFGFDVSSHVIRDEGLVVISVIDLYSRLSLSQYAEIYDQVIVNICKECVAQDKTPVLVSLCELEKDPDAVNRIYEQLPEAVQRKTRCHYYKNNLSEIIELFAAANYVVATRFHAMILAMKFRKPFFCVSYNEKIKQVLLETGIDHYCELEKLNTFNVKSMLTETGIFVSEDYIKHATKHFSQFDEYVNNEKKDFNHYSSL